MAKVKVVSDLHVEFDQDDGIKASRMVSGDHDILVVAGDLGNSKVIESALRKLCDANKEVVYVLGNHDLWSSSFPEVFDMLGALEKELGNLHWLENKRKNVAGVNFAGTTLWYGDSIDTSSRFIDFRAIEGGCHAIFERNDLAKKFLKEEVREGDFVVTHHLPSHKCVAPRWEGSPSNCYFVCDVEEVMHNNKPAYWAFGHTHDPVHMTIGETELFCNPRGYPGEGVPFKKDFIVDTEL
jgi:Icc-related predicted phosphoesterase